MSATCAACKHEAPTGPNCEGCLYRCEICGLHLAGKEEVRGHFFLMGYLHRYFRDTKTGKLYHHTGKGLSPDLPGATQQTQEEHHGR